MSMFSIQFIRDFSSHMSRPDRPAEVGKRVFSALGRNLASEWLGHDLYRRFRTCDKCDRIYWEGSHWRRMEQVIGDLVKRSNESNR
jgi:hypothetical protein